MYRLVKTIIRNGQPLLMGETITNKEYEEWGLSSTQAEKIEVKPRTKAKKDTAEQGEAED